MTAAVANHLSLLPPRIPIAMAVSKVLPRMSDESMSKAKMTRSENENKAVRGRRERPCDACRKRKSKCVANEGLKRICTACGVHGQECTYNENPQPRKRRLEPNGKDANTIKRRSIRSETQPDGVGDNIPTIKREHDSSSMILESITPSTSSGETSCGSSQHQGTHVGYTTEYEPMLFDLSPTSSWLGHNAHYQKPDGHNAFLLRDRPCGCNQESHVGAFDSIEDLVHHTGPSLVRRYRKTTHISLIVVEEAFFKGLESREKSGLDPTLLAAMYALTVSTGPRVPRGSSSQIDVAQVEDMAFRLFSSSLARPTLSTVQAGILLMQTPHVDSRTLNMQLVNVAYELGLHLDCSTWKLSDEERGLRTRLAWALYMQDKWCSLIHGRPSLISQHHWAVPQLDEDDFPKSVGSDVEVSAEDVRRGQDLFRQLAALTEILATILDTFYTLKAMREVAEASPNGTQLILERAKPVQIKLKHWFTRLPSNLKMENHMTSVPSCTGYLHLAYFATEITLHRCIIRSLSASPPADIYLSHVCRSAAKTRLISAMDFVNRLRPEHLTAFWYFPSKVNFALVGTFGSLLLATAPAREEADFYRTRLAEYRWTLRVSSATAGFLAFAVDSLDASSRLLEGLPSKPSTGELGALLARDAPMADVPRDPSPPGLVSPSPSTAPSSGSGSYDGCC